MAQLRKPLRQGLPHPVRGLHRGSSQKNYGAQTASSQLTIRPGTPRRVGIYPIPKNRIMLLGGSEAPPSGCRGANTSTPSRSPKYLINTITGRIRRRNARGARPRIPLLLAGIRIAAPIHALAKRPARLEMHHVPRRARYRLPSPGVPRASGRPGGDAARSSQSRGSRCALRSPDARPCARASCSLQPRHPNQRDVRVAAPSAR